MNSFVISSGRSGNCKAPILLPDATIVVPDAEEKDYSSRFETGRILGHGLRNVARIKNWIIANYEPPVMIVDDMVSGFTVPQFPGMPVPIDTAFALSELDSLAKGMSASGYRAFGLSSNRIKGSIFKPIRFGSDIDKNCVVVLQNNVRFNEDLELLEDLWFSAEDIATVACVDYLQVSRTTTRAGGRYALKSKYGPQERAAMKQRFPELVDILRSSMR